MNPVNLESLNFPLHGSRLIEASAGTGKTFTIALLYVRLVLGHGGANAFKEPLNPPQILVVTFTDAATQELRDRIRLRLSEAAQCFAEPLGSHDSLLEQLRADYPAEHWPDCARRLQLAGEWMDEAAVSTIHGWCYRMLREHAFDSGSLFTQTLETDQSELLAEVVRDYWRRHFYGLSLDQAEVIADYFSGPQELGQLLSSLLARRTASFMHGGAVLPAPGTLAALLKAPADWKVSLSALEQLARTAWRDDRQQIEQLLHGMRSKLHGNTYRGVKDDQVFAGWLEALANWSQGQTAPGNLSKFGQERFKLTGGAQAPSHAAFAAIDALADHQASKQDIRAQLLLHALAEISERFDTEKLRRAEIGFDDLLNRLDAALQGQSGERLAKTVREQYPVALIDEFQDTDPVQYRIFESIYRIADNSPDSGLFMIGDPKQAIYAFRGADIYTYLSAREATSGRHYTLGKNFRSTEAMVTAATRNDYSLGLMNGDIGIALYLPVPDDSQPGRMSLRVAFPRNDGTGDVRFVLPSRLVEVETVYAMTVHKSQGSEFNHTALLLPDALNPVLTKELLYTGITRAKNWFSLIEAGPGVFEGAVSRNVQRLSGLALQLKAELSKEAQR